MNRSERGIIVFEVLIALVLLAIMFAGIYRHALGEKGHVATAAHIGDRAELVQYRLLLYEKIRAELSCTADACAPFDLPPSPGNAYTAAFGSGYPLFDGVTGIVHADFEIQKGGVVETVACRY